MFSNLTNVSSNSLINTINTFWESTSSIFWTNSSFIYQGYWVALTDYLTMPQASLAYANVQLPINLLFFCQLFVNSLFIFTLVSAFLVYLSNQGIQLLSFNLKWWGSLFRLLRLFSWRWRWSWCYRWCNYLWFNVCRNHFLIFFYYFCYLLK